MYPRNMEPAVRVELTTGGLRNRCSTTELRWRAEDIILESDETEQCLAASYRFCLIFLICFPLIIFGSHVCVNFKNAT